MTVVDATMPLSTISMTNRQKMEEPKNINQQDLIDMYRTPPPTTVECILFSSSCKTYINIYMTIKISCTFK